jgi:hypothetical protein
MKKAIFYKSVLGASAKYAKWLSEELNSDSFTYKQSNRTRFEEHEMLIITSGTYLGWMPLKDFLVSNWKHIEGKIVVVIAVGILAPEDANSIKSFESIPFEIRKQIKYFKLPGQIGPSSPQGEVKKENLNEVLEFVKRYD